MQKKTVKLESSWLTQLSPEFEKEYMIRLKKYLFYQKKTGVQIFPEGSHYFGALNRTKLDSVRVVIIGQDPYHGPGQAHGFSFSVPKGVPQPPSLKNIFREIQDDLGLQTTDFRHGCLESWADQGVLLLNSVLTVEKNKAGSHQKKGWETFTDRIVEILVRADRRIVFMLWGGYAQKKGQIIGIGNNFVLKASHPSPLSAHRGFFGCKHFSNCNQILIRQGDEPIDWRVI